MSFADDTYKMVEDFIPSAFGVNKFSSKAEEIIRDYTTLLQRTKKELSEKFTKNELMYIYDVLNGTIVYGDSLAVKPSLVLEIEDGDKYDNLGEKWKVDAKVLAKKVNDLPEFSAYGLIKMAHDFWADK